jgi:uncharacterized protein YwlG (UPF0340 family)
MLLELKEKKLKTSTTGAQGIKTLTKKKLQMHKSQHRMKQQDTHSPSKANSTTEVLNTFIEKESSNNIFKKIVKMINDLKKETQKLVFELKEDVNKRLNELELESNKQMSEIKKTIQDMKEEINKEETLKYNPK